MKKNYDNGYFPDNVYGHAVALLAGNLSDRREDGAIHLDLGCGYGRIAEPLVDETGLRYVGLDIDPTSVQSLVDRGLEAYCVDLRLHAAELKKEIVGRIAGRSVASISLIDVLEHIADASALLSVIRELLLESGAVFVISVPNIAHRDVGFKLAFGRYDIRATGILDHTHFHAFTESGLQAYLAHHGLHPFARNDVVIENSDQRFPATHAALSNATLLGSYLRDLRASVDEMSTVNQLVAVCLAGPVREAEYVHTELAIEEQARAPFLSVVTRTQGRRPATLRDALLALAAQSCDDFELIVVGHKLDRESQLMVERLIEDVPDDLRRRTRLIRVEHGNRTAPLNEGFAVARGEYVVILDDDDMPMAHWVETFKSLAIKAPGCVLRAVAVKQECDEVNCTFGSTSAPRTVSGFIKEYPSSFDLFAHLEVNLTPPIALAFPRSAFDDLNIRFDESLSTTEDWDFLMRVAAVCGVASTPAITCIYRWWKGSESSRSVHPPEEWIANHHRIFAKLDSAPMLLPAGSASKLRALTSLNERQTRMLLELKQRLSAVGQTVELGELQPADAGPRIELLALLQSRSWRITAPLRAVKRILHGWPKHKLDVSRMSSSEINEAISQIRASASWRLTAPMRRLRDAAGDKAQ